MPAPKATSIDVYVSFKLPFELHQRLIALCEASGDTIGEALVDAVALHVDQAEGFQLPEIVQPPCDVEAAP